MTSLRNILLLGGLVVLSACATQTFTPDQAPEYEITRSFTPFYLQRPAQGARTDISLSEKTRVKLLRKGTVHSFVQLEDSRTGYVANKNMAVAPPAPEKKPTSDEAPAKPRRKKRPSPTPSPSPVSQDEQSKDIPSRDVIAPTPTPPPDLPKAPQEAPASTPTPTPQAPLEKPKFRL